MPHGRDAANLGVTRYSWYVLFILLCVYSINWMDRYVLVMLLEPIKRDLRLSDASLGLLSGFAFALVYSLAGIPLARWADRGSRRSLISLGVSVWSLSTALSGFATTLMQLSVARIGVALGESACSPPACSIIADYFPARRRATAFAVYGVGISIGIALGLSIGGWANERYGWHAAFFIAGSPGLLLAVLVRYTIREPLRGGVDGFGVDTRFYSLPDTLHLVLSRRSFLAAAAGIGLLSFSGNAFETWTPVYLMRLYHMSTGTIGAWLGPLEGTGGIVGTMVGGILADQLGRRNVRWYLWLPAIAAAAMVGAMWAFLHDATSQTSMFGCYLLSILTSASFMAPVVAIAQRIVPVRMRALSTALLYLLLNLIGPGAGPLVAGALNDALNPAYGIDAIRMSLSITLLGALGGIVLMLYAAWRLPRDLRLANANPEGLPRFSTHAVESS